MRERRELCLAFSLFALIVGVEGGTPSPTRAPTPAPSMMPTTAPTTYSSPPEGAMNPILLYGGVILICLVVYVFVEVTARIRMGIKEKTIDGLP